MDHQKHHRNDLDRAVAPEAADKAAPAARQEGDARAAAGRSDQQIEAVQMKNTEVVDADAEAIQASAAEGVQGAGGKLPFSAEIQASFGPDYDVSSIQAHTGSEAAKASESMGASAYATGDKVAFKENPGLALAAHEAAHVIQQRAGATPDGGVGQAGDSFEASADAVAERVVAGESAAELLPDAGATESGGDAAVQLYTEERVKGQYARVSENGTVIVLGKENYSQDLYATDALINDANTKLAASGDKGSYIKLVPTGDTVTYKETALKKVAPVFDAKGDKANEDLADANAAKDENDVMSLWADCGRSSRAVMGSHNDAAPHAEYTEGATTKETGAAYRPAAYSDVIYKDVMPDFLALPAAQNFMKDGVHYRSGDKTDIIEPASADQAREQYWELGDEGRRAFDRFAGINTGANPEVGGGYTMNTEYDMPGFQGGRSTWNFHWAGVIMKDGSDNVTLENYADGNGYDSVNVDWNFQMYGTIKKGQTFQEEHLASDTHGNRASTFAVKPQD